MDPRVTPPGERTPTATDCYRYVLSTPEVDVSLPGPRDGAELDGAMAALDKGPMDAEEIAVDAARGRRRAPRRQAGAPVEVLDRIAARFRSGPSEVLRG